MLSHLMSTANELAKEIDSVNDPFSLLERITALEARCAALEEKYSDLQNLMTRGDSHLASGLNKALDRMERAVVDLRNELDAR